MSLGLESNMVACCMWCIWLFFWLFNCCPTMSGKQPVNIKWEPIVYRLWGNLCETDDACSKLGDLIWTLLELRALHKLSVIFVTSAYPAPARIWRRVLRLVLTEKESSSLKAYVSTCLQGVYVCVCMCMHVCVYVYVCVCNCAPLQIPFWYYNLYVSIRGTVNCHMQIYCAQYEFLMTKGFAGMVFPLFPPPPLPARQLMDNNLLLVIKKTYLDCSIVIRNNIWKWKLYYYRIFKMQI